jgi:hypothetical protein
MRPPVAAVPCLGLLAMRSGVSGVFDDRAPEYLSGKRRTSSSWNQPLKPRISPLQRMEENLLTRAVSPAR